MGVLWVEVNCPEHGFERFRIKIIKKFNVSSDEVIPKFRRKPSPGDLSCVYVGRDVSMQQVQQYVLDYFRRRGLWDSILLMKIDV